MRNSTVLEQTATKSTGVSLRSRLAGLGLAVGLLAGVGLAAPDTASAKESVDTLDPLGTSEESGSGEIIIYRDRNGEIEGTSETHEFMAGPDGQGDYRIGPFGR